MPLDEFRIVNRGPFDRVTTWAARNRAVRAIALAVIAWVPLVVLTLAASRRGAAPTVTFLDDLSVHLRFLFVIPLLVLAEAAIGERTRKVVITLVDSGLVPPQDEPRLAEAVRKAHRLLDSALVEALLIAGAAVANSFLLQRLLADDTLFWFEQGAPGAASLAPAGWWYALVSPIPGFLFARWGWRYAIWCLLLRRVSQLELRLVGTHPDGAGGVGFIAIGQTAFASIGLAASTVVAGAAATEILHAGAKLASFQSALVAFVVGAVAVGMLPSPIFMGPLMRTKRAGLLAYSALATRYAQSFEGKWLGSGGTSDELLGSGDIQSLADLGGSFDRLSAMRPFPFDKRTVFTFAAAAAVPLLPLALTVLPLREIVKTLLRAVV